MANERGDYIVAVRSFKGGARIVDVAESLGITKQSVSTMLAKLEKEGAIFRQGMKFFARPKRPSAPPDTPTWRRLLCEQCQIELVQPIGVTKPRLRFARAAEALDVIWWYRSNLNRKATLKEIASLVTFPRGRSVNSKTYSVATIERLVQSEGARVARRPRGLEPVSRQSASRYVQILKDEGLIDDDLIPIYQRSSECIWCKRIPK